MGEYHSRPANNIYTYPWTCLLLSVDPPCMYCGMVGNTRGALSYPRICVGIRDSALISGYMGSGSNFVAHSDVILPAQ